MADVHLICGKICAGKSTYAHALAKEKNAVILSVDEITTLLSEDLGERHDEIARRIRLYLMDKAAQIAACGCPVILDWGFWTKDMRRETDGYLRERGISPVWHYLAVSDKVWAERIEKRNGCRGAADYFVDEGLREKCLRLFEPPRPEEIQVWRAVE